MPRSPPADAPSWSDRLPSYHPPALPPTRQRRGESVERVRVVVALLALLAVAFAAYVLGTRGRAIDDVRHQQYAAEIARLQSLDHQLREDVMRVRAGLVANYDPVVSTLAELRGVHAHLADVPEFLAEPARAELRAAVARSDDAFVARAERIERFKTSSAILRNSLRYIPIAAAEIVGDEGDPELLLRSNALVRDVLMLYVWSDPTLAARIQASLDALAATPGAPAEGLAVLRQHTRVVLDRHARVEALIAELFALQREATSERVELLYTRGHDVAAARAAHDDSIVAILAVVVVVLASGLVIARLRRSASVLRRTMEELGQAVELKNRFVSMTSHEFRTPLSVILSSSELLEAYGDRWPPEKKHAHFDRVRGAVQAMTMLIDGILLIGRSEAGVLDFKPTPIDLDGLCREVLAAVEARSGGSHEVVYEPPEITDAIGDPRLIRHILDNLVANAIKYSPAGGRVTVSVGCDGREARITVDDQGLGIPKEDVASLFESFRRGSNVGNIPGTGLGLAVVRRATDLHHGRVEVRSELGQGARFDVWLPVEPAQRAARGEQAA